MVSPVQGRLKRADVDSAVPVGLELPLLQHNPGLCPISVNLIWETSSFEKTWFLGSPHSPQNRHPERSASQMDRVPQRLVARSRRACPERSRGNPDVAYLPMLFGAFQLPPLVGAQALGKTTPTLVARKRSSSSCADHPECKDFTQTDCWKRPQRIQGCMRDHGAYHGRSCSSGFGG